MSKSTLGRGLNSLIPPKNAGTSPVAAGEAIQHIAVDLIQPNTQQPRQSFDRDALEELTESIKIHGIIQPLVVIQEGAGYQLIAGERRFRAAKILGKKKVPVIVRSATEQEKLELALVENVQRQNLNPIDKAVGYQQLIDQFNLTQDEVAKKVGQSRAAVANALRLLGLPQNIQQALIEGTLTEGHAKVLLSVRSEEEQKRLFKEIISNKLSVRVAESHAKSVTVKKHTRNKHVDPNIQEKEDMLREALGTKVELKRKGDAGTILIHYYSYEEFQEIMRKITK